MAAPAKKAAAPALGELAPKSDEDVEAVADALEIAFGKRLTPEQVEAFCLAAAMGVAKHESGGY
jgi:hypothetical protein